MKRQVIKNSIIVVGLFLLGLILRINLLIPAILATLFIYLEVWKRQKLCDCRFLHLIFLFMLIFA